MVSDNVPATALTVEEYIQSELLSDTRHEFINRQLIETPGEKDINNELALYLCTYLPQQLKPKGFQVYINDVKVATPDKKNIITLMYLPPKNLVPITTATLNTNLS